MNTAKQAKYSLMLKETKVLLKHLGNTRLYAIRKNTNELHLATVLEGCVGATVLPGMCQILFSDFVGQTPGILAEFGVYVKARLEAAKREALEEIVQNVQNPEAEVE
jgi:hypothetical protein